MAQHPERFKHFIEWMALGREARCRWMAEYPIERYTGDWDPNLPVFVDIGGNVGHHCMEFRKRFPNITGRVILQDIPGTLQHAPDLPGIEKMEYNFFEPQPVKGGYSRSLTHVHFADGGPGAKFYCLSWILHNYKDEEVNQILRQTKSAMTADSVLIINDMVLPERGVPIFSAQIDIMMMCCFGSKERTMNEWKAILDGVDLVIQEHIAYDSEQSHGVIGAVLEER